MDIGLQGFLRYQGSRSGSRSRSGRVFGLVRSGYGSGTRSRSGRVFAIWSNAQQCPMEILSGATSGIFIGGASMQGKGSVYKKEATGQLVARRASTGSQGRGGPKLLYMYICVFVYLCICVPSHCYVTTFCRLLRHSYYQFIAPNPHPGLAPFDIFKILAFPSF